MLQKVSSIYILTRTGASATTTLSRHHWPWELHTHQPRECVRISDPRPVTALPPPPSLSRTPLAKNIHGSRGYIHVSLAAYLPDRVCFGARACERPESSK